MTTVERRALTLRLSIVFRLAERSDLPKLEWNGEYVHFRRVFHQTFEEQRAGRRLMLLADLNNYPVGQIFVQLDSPDGWHNGQRGYLYSLRVIEPLRSQGIGTVLIREAERILIDHDYDVVSIAAAKDNLRARRLYERLGYAVAYEDDGRWQYVDHQGYTRHVVEPCWILEKNLKNLKTER